MKMKNIALAALMLMMPLMMGAQTLKGTYFLDNSLNRHKMNPAFAPDNGYFQIPVIGNTSVGLLSNLDLQTFLYPMDGQLYTFLNKNVTFAQFDKALPTHPHIDASADVNLINFGWLTDKGSFWSVDFGIRTNVDMDVPGDLFRFAKKGTGTSGASYNLGHLSANASASLQAALGYSRDLSDLVEGLRVGAKARVILPVAYAGVDLEKVGLTTGEERWQLDAQGSIYTAAKGLDIMGADGSLSPSFSYEGLMSGFGMSFDLGAQYDLKFDGFINGVSFSAAFTDLGFVSYNADAVRAYQAGGQLEWTGFNISMDEGAIDKSLEELKGKAEDMLKLKEMKGSSLKRSTLPSFYVGAEMPFLNNKMSIGALYSARRSYNYTRNELTLSYNLTPARWFALGINYSFLNVAKTMGWVLEFTPKAGPSFYIGSDYTFLEFAKAPADLGIGLIPTSWRFNLNFGLAVAIGGKKK